MSSVYLIALSVSQDEGAFSLKELNFLSPDSKSWRRYQIIKVVRGDKLAEYKRDLGPAKSFQAEEFQVLGGVVDEATGRGEILHTVGELQDIANHMRQFKPFTAEIEPTDFPTLYQAEQETQRQKLLRKGRPRNGNRAENRAKDTAGRSKA